MLCGILGLLTVAPATVTYFQTGHAPHTHVLFVPAFFIVMSCLTGLSGLLLDGIRKGRHEVARLAYTRHGSVRVPSERSDFARTRCRRRKPSVGLLIREMS